MSSELLYAVGTLLTWVGWAFALTAVWRWMERLTSPVGEVRDRSTKGAIKATVGSAVLLVIGTTLPVITKDARPGSWRLPIVWFIMPFAAWAMAACLVACLVRLFQILQALNDQEKKDRFNAALSWLVGTAFFYFLYSRDPSNTVAIIRGSIPFSVQTGVVLLVLGFGGVAAMAWSARSAVAKGYARGVVSQIALLAGSVVFGLPFAFLLITSFKEDRDMSSQHGIIWVPKVTQTVPYKDPKNPLYEANYEGQTVQGTILQELPDNKVRIDILKPMSIRGIDFDTSRSEIKEIPRDVQIVTAKLDGKDVHGMAVENLEDGRIRVRMDSPPELNGQEHTFMPSDVEPVRNVGLNWKNYPEALSYLPPETDMGLVYLKNTLIIVVLSVIGTIFSSSIVSYAFSRMKFPGRNPLFAVLLSTMMLPAAVTLLPQFLIFRAFGWIDTLYPLWVPAFFGSAFNIFLLRQFFMNIPMELEDAAKIDGCSYLKTFWSIMLPQIKPALAVIFIWTFLASWNNFMGPLIYINSPENMPLSYALQLFAGDRGGEPGYMMAFATLTMLPVLAIFFFFQRYFIEGVTLSGLGGR